MNVNFCNCESCMGRDFKINKGVRRGDTLDAEDFSSDSEDIDSFSSPVPKTPKKFKTSKFSSNFGFVSPMSVPGKRQLLTPSQKGLNNSRPKRVLFKTVPKESISCEEFNSKYEEIIRSKSNQDAYQTSQRLIKLIRLSFPLDLNILGRSFLSNKSGEKIFRLDLDGLRKIFKNFCALNFEEVSLIFEQRIKGIIKLLIKKTANNCKIKNSVKISRIFVIIFESPAFKKLCGVKEDLNFINEMFKVISTLRSQSSSRLAAFFASYKKENFVQIVENIQLFLSEFCICSVIEVFKIEKISEGLAVLNIFRRANRISSPKIVEETTFQNLYLSELLFYRFNPENIIKRSTPLLKHAWILNTNTKWKLLLMENVNEQNKASEKALLDAVKRSSRIFTRRAQRSSAWRERDQPVDCQGNPAERRPLRVLEEFEESRNALQNADENSLENTLEGIEYSDYSNNEEENGDFDALRKSDSCYFVVCRDHTVADTFKFLLNYSKSQLKRPLRVIFTGEQGVDEGGLKSEFFQLLVREIFSKDFGLFKEDEDSKLPWFSHSTKKNSLKNFEFCGMLVGLALFNGVILDITLPKAFYKLLLGQKPNFQDLIEISPSLGKGLQNLLNFEGDVENTFCHSFEVSFENLNQTLSEELIEGGANVPVTNENKERFVELYSNWFLVKSISKQANALKKGFQKICRDDSQWILNLFNVEDLKLALGGKEELDFSAWKTNLSLKGYEFKDPVIMNFWNVLESLSFEDKQKFLFFVTGCKRAPIQGLSDLPLTVVKGNSTEMLPLSRTCFNQLTLPPYETIEKMREKISLALEYSEGFGLQ